MDAGTMDVIDPVVRRDALLELLDLEARLLGLLLAFGQLLLFVSRFHGEISFRK
jgi:hypothetical protein